MRPQLQFLCFLLLFAHRIKAEPDQLLFIVPEDQVHEDADDLALTQTATPKPDPLCDKDQFKCIKSGECIDNYKYCDYIIDCADQSDEWKCGTCDFSSNETASKCTWKDPNTGKTPSWSVVHGALSTPVYTSTTPPRPYQLISPNLHGIGFLCRLVLKVNIASSSSSAVLYVIHHFTNSKGQASQKFAKFNKHDMRTSSFTEVSMNIRPPPYSSGDYYHGAYTIELVAYLYKPGDQIAVQKIHFENCNAKRTVGDCDFEGADFCHWQLHPSSPLQWNIGRGDQINETYTPTADHTLGTGRGHFAWTKAASTTQSSTSNTSPVALLTSPTLISRACVSLWYYMDGASFLQLSLTSRSVHGGSDSNRDIVTGVTGGVWKYKQADISRADDFTVTIEAEVEDPGGIIAIDDLRVKFGKCINPVCTFEEGNCDFKVTTSSGSNSTWTMVTAKKMQDLTSMTFADHSTGTLNGHMMLFIGRAEGDMSWLTSPEADFSGYRCLQFYYYISDDDVGSLEVYHHSGFSIPDLDVDKKNGYIYRTQSTLLLGGNWRKIRLTLPPLEASVVDFIATAGSDVNYGFISLDDIQLTNGRCSPSVSCDFEYDNCGWSLNGDLSMAPFERTTPSQRKSHYCIPPAADHTFRTANGHFLYFCYHSSQQLVTSITSEDFDGHKNWCFSFWTYFSTTPKKNNIRVDVYLYNLDGNTQLTSIKADPKNASSGWQYHEMNIGGDDNYEIYYLGITVTPFEYVTNQGVAIDDMKLEPFKCGYKPKPGPDPNHPGGPKIPPQTELFDYECNFELNTCNYYANSSHGRSWYRTAANFGVNLRPNAPVTDHTEHSEDGSFLEFSGSPPAKYYAVLQSKSVISPNMFPNATIASLCVDWWYVMNGEAINWLNVSAVSGSNDTTEVVAHLAGSYGPTWRHKAVTVTFFDDIYLYFSGGTSDPEHGVLALDDIGVTVGDCPFELNCDFQSNTCGWDNNISLPLRFIPTSAFALEFTSSVNASVPISDHTDGSIYGNYMYLNASFESIGEAAQLISPVTRPDKKCLQFWYYFYGPSVGSLNVYVVYNGLTNLKYLLKSELNSDLAAWQFNQIPLQHHYYDMDFQFVIEVRRGNGWGDNLTIAIDDVEIKEFCQPVGTCDFETGFCEYGNVGDPLFREKKNQNSDIWTRAHGIASTGVQFGLARGPTGDHTLGKYGVFVYIDKGPNASLYTPYFTIATPMCLNFYYYINASTTSQPNPYILVEMAYLDIDAEPIAIINSSAILADRLDRGWRQHSVTVTTLGKKLSLQFIGYVDHPKTLVALDDITLKSGACEDAHKPKRKFACVPQPKLKTDYIPLTKVCDFVRDCPNGADEEACGYSCTFEAGVQRCPWTVVNVTSTFLKVDLAHPKDNPFKRVVPLRDHKHGNDFMGTYLRLWDAPGPFIDNPEANYESPWIQNSSPLCAFIFYVYITDPKDRQALVRVNIIRPDNPLGIEIYREEATQSDQMRYWSSPRIAIGRIRGRFKIQINARMKISQGGGAIAIDDLQFYKSLCTLETAMVPSPLTCAVKSNKYKCADRKHCFGEDKLCDFTDNCGDGSDESPKYCDTKTRSPLRTDFEAGTGYWHIRPHLPNQNSTSATSLNGLHWGPVDEIDDYAYGVKRDHTLNNEFGHIVYLWNQNQEVGQIESPLMSTDSTQGYCVLRFYYLYKTRNLVLGKETGSEIGHVHVYLKFTENSKRLFRYGTISRVNSYHFDLFEVPLVSTTDFPFFVVLEIVPGSDHYGIWAIDDISFTSGCIPADAKTVTNPNYTPFPLTTSRSTSCPSDQDFQCDTYMCILARQVCDFHYDCKDGTDEANCGEDTFKTGWSDASEGRLQWAVGQDGIVRSVTHDNGVSSTAYFNSVNFGTSGASCTMTFSYFIGQRAESLELYLDEIRFEKDFPTVQSRLFSSTRSTSLAYGRWNAAKIFIGEHMVGWRLSFVGRKDVVNNQTDSLRLKGVHFLNCVSPQYNYTACQNKDYFTCGNGVCIPKNQLCDYQDNCGDGSDEKNCAHLASFRCSFEGGQKTSPTCDLDLTDGKWKRFAGYETTDFEGPGVDHTTDTEMGHFLMLTGAVFSQVTINSDTAIRSPLFDPDSSGNCHLRFWYMMNGIGTLSVERQSAGTEMKLISSVDTTPNDTYVWKRFSEPLVSKVPFQIVLNGKIDNINTKTFLAIDDISFTSACKLHNKKPPPHHHPHHNNGTTPTPSTSCELNDQFECTDHTCIPFDEVGDFYPTCADGDDEWDSPATCDFDHNVLNDQLCFWGTNDDDAVPVKLTASSESAITAKQKARYFPKTDNTLKTASGRFLLIYGINQTETVDTKLDLNIYSPEYVSAAPGCTFSLDYYVATDAQNAGGSSTYMISLVEITVNGPVQYDLTPIFASDTDSVNQWKTLTVGIGRRANTFQVILSRLHNPNMTDTLAVDNIRFTGCAYTAPNDLKPKKTKCSSGQFTCGTHLNCIPASQVCDLKADCPDGLDEKDCSKKTSDIVTFEAADGFKSSGWTLGSKGKKGEDPWTILSGPAPQRAAMQTGPPFDHTFFNTSGHYLYSRPFDFGVDAWFISPVLKPTTAKTDCHLLFYYYIYGLNQNQIDIYVRTGTTSNIHTVTSIKVKSEDEWRQAMVKLESPRDHFQVIISGVAGGDFAGIGLDDVLLSAGCEVDKNTPTLSPGTPVPTTIGTTPTPAPTPDPGSHCKSGQYYCKADAVCLPLITRCNFVHDCSDGSDERPPECTQRTCPIASGNLNDDCGLDIFYSEGALNYSWIFSTSDNFTAFTGIHISDLPHSFIYMDLSMGHRDDYSNLVSKTISESSSSCMLQFKYACDPRHCPLQVSVISHHANGNAKSLLWVPIEDELVASASGYKVDTALLYLGRRNSYQISIGSLKQSNVKSYVIISDISFVNCTPAAYIADPSSVACDANQFQCSKSYGNCIPKSAVCDYQDDCRLNEDEVGCSKYIGRCDMEDLEQCDFWNLEEPDPRWSFLALDAQYGLANLPSMDHTKHSETNYFLTFHSNMMKNYLGPSKVGPGSTYEVHYVSNGLISDSKDACRLRFWYNLIGRPTDCNLKIYKRYNSSQLELIATPLSARLADYWIKADISLSPKSGSAADVFQIVLAASVALGASQPCSVNIDDLSITPSCVPLANPHIPPHWPNPNTTWNLCRPNFQCALSKKCYTFAQRCDFIADCDTGSGDKTDEADCPAMCTFDEGGNSTALCGWYTPKGSAVKFEKSSGSSPSLTAGGTGPKGDHTTGKGSYIVAKNFSAASGNKVQLHSPYFSSSGGNCRFSFAFFLNEPSHVETIKLYLKADTHPPKVTQIWSYNYHHAYAQVWNQETVNIGHQKGFSLYFEATNHLRTGSKVDLAFDDLQFTNCQRDQHNLEVTCAEDEYRCADRTQCIDYWHRCDGEVDCDDGSDEKHCLQTNGTCWFTDTNWKTRCNWIDLKKDFTFVYENVALQKGPDREKNTGPQELLNGVYGYVLMKSKGRKFGERAAIATPVFPASTGVCSLSFYYYMYGADTMGELLVYTLAEKTGQRIDYFHQSGNQGLGWMFSSNLMVGSPADFRVVFEGVVGAGPYTDIAIAFVSFSADCAAGRWVEKASANLTIGDTCAGFYCHRSHECIDSDWVCDHQVDCVDGSDEANCQSYHNRPSSGPGRSLIIGFAVLAIVLVVALPGAVFSWRRYVASRDGGDRVPFFDNSFETTSHRDLDFTTISRDSRTTSGRTTKVVTFEMTTRKSNKAD